MIVLYPMDLGNEYLGLFLKVVNTMNKKSNASFIGRKEVKAYGNCNANHLHYLRH